MNLRGEKMNLRTSYKNVKTKPSYETEEPKTVKPTKIQVLQARKAEALALNRQMQVVDKQHEDLLDDWELSSRNQKKLGKKRVSNRYYAKQDKMLDKRSDELYTQFYNHMNKDFDVNKSTISFANSKYKYGFCDNRYIQDMYNQKIALEKAKLAKKKR